MARRARRRRGPAGTRRRPRRSTPTAQAAAGEVRAGPAGRGPAARPACSPARSRRNPVNGEQIPVFVADYVLMGYGTGAIMAVPGPGRARLGVRRGLRPADRPHRRSRPRASRTARRSPATGRRSTPRRFLDGTGRRRRRRRRSSSGWRQHGAGRGAVTYRLRDWLFCRQRYWGEPFPIVYDETGLPIAVPESMLPVELPETDDFSPKSFPPEDADSTPEPPLGRLTDWVEVELDLGDGPKQYRRETNTMPNWAGSCWYELRYLDPTNTERARRPRGRALLDGPDRPTVRWAASSCTSAVSSTRCCTCCTRGSGTRCCSTWATVSSSEPFHRLVNQGMLQLPAYTNEDGFYVEAAEVEERDGQLLLRRRRGRRRSSARSARA